MEAYFPGNGLVAIFFFISFLIFIEFCSKKSHRYHPSEIPQLHTNIKKIRMQMLFKR